MWTRLHTAAQLTDAQRSDLADGKPVVLPQGQFNVLRQVMRALDGRSVQAIDQATSALPQQNQRDLAAAVQIMSSPNVRSMVAGPWATAPSVPDRGGMSHLPIQVRTLLTTNPVAVSEHWTAVGPFVSADLPRADDFAALTDIVGRGSDAGLGSDLDRGLLKQAAEIAGAVGSPKVTMTMEGRGVDPAEIGALADRMVDAGGRDSQAVHDFVTGTNMASTVDHSGAYNPDDHVFDLLQHEWSPDQHGAAQMFVSIGEAAKQPVESYANGQGGESATALAHTLAKYSATLALHMPNHGTNAFGQVNPELTQRIANSMRPYLGNLAGVTDRGAAEHLLLNQTAQPMDTVTDLADVLSVLDSDPKAARIVNDGGRRWLDYLQYRGGADPSKFDNAYRAGQLDTAMQQGMTDRVSVLAFRHRWDLIQRYNDRTSRIDPSAMGADLAPVPGAGSLAGALGLLTSDLLELPEDPQNIASDVSTREAVASVGAGFSMSTLRIAFDQVQGHLSKDPLAAEHFVDFMKNWQLDWSAVTESVDAQNRFRNAAAALAGLDTVNFYRWYREGQQSGYIRSPR